VLKNVSYEMLAYILNVVSAVGLVLVNKKVVIVDKFDCMTILTALHFYFSFIACSIMLCAGYLQYKSVKNYGSILRIVLGSLGSIIFMNFNLAENSVGFYQISKLLCIPVTLLLEWTMNQRRQKITIFLLLSLVMIIAGVICVVVNDVKYTDLGLIWALFGIICTSLAQIYFSPLQKQLELNSIQLLFHTSPWLTFGSFIITPLFDHTNKLMQINITFQLLIDLLLSSILAFVLNISNYLVLSVSFPITYQVLGHIKTIFIFAGGIIFYDQVPSSKAIFGIIVTLIGVILYSEDNRRQQQEIILFNKNGKNENNDNL